MPLAPDVSSRDRQPELMDDPGLQEAPHREALHGLERINAVSGSLGTLWGVLGPLARRRRGTPLHILDVATGAGDLPIGLWARGRSRGLDLQVEACDASATAVRFARDRARQHGAPVRFFQLDVIRENIPRPYDAVMSSLFLHHLGEQDVIAVLQKLAGASRQVLLVNDLARSRAGYVFAWVGCRLLSRSRIVHSDGPHSVRAAFTIEEIRSLAGRAGLSGSTVEGRWPCRWLLQWSRP